MIDIDLEEHEETIGSTRRTTIGVITRMMARRYARAVEDDNPLYHDIAYARAHGFDDLVVPPNFLPAIIERSAGRPSTELRGDGVDPDLFPIPLPEDALLMNGGQNISFVRYVTAGESLDVEETLMDLYQKESDSMGLLTFLDLESEYLAADDEVVCTCAETIIVGERQ